MTSASFETKNALMERRVTPDNASNHQPTCDATKKDGTKNCICFLSRRARPVDYGKN